VTEFQRLVGRLDYPMHVVTVSDGGRRAGCLVGFAGQCSIHPPRYWVCVSRANHTYALVERAETMVVHLLGARDRGLAELFGHETGDDVDKFAQCRWRPGPDGATPVLEGCAWFAGRTLDRVDCGDHVGFLLEPYEAWAGPDDLGQLGFQAAKDITPGHPA
jgi:flavin reductase (DIM6/NTAB) family NADH-FMN oxidoreductase RutF